MPQSFQVKMLGHGALMMCSALLFGVFYWMSIVGGFEIIPGYILEFDMPGTPEGWKKAHSGPMLNGMMVIAIAVVLPHLDFAAKKAKLLGAIIILDGWSNVGFYFFGNLSDNRALAFADSHLGEGGVFSFLGLAPAYLFGVLALWALAVIGLAALKQARQKAA
ncbi:hypothetical protein I6N98_13795 [Spongiibacter nanhainus]|uniref:Styrene-oxide isomerase n=1 Tax=Spongiibacter nanhainus TaxID=2794344 RepID=A0A7T4QZ24_9GAMM|nr:hypothetical protein [Spongiibacter nanhainus]QQD17430.1 hypothetical protein I6N98_13795 [Spongiibacter nanhainus]